MNTYKKNILLIERNSNKTAKIIYKRIFGYIDTENSEKEIRFCQEIFRHKHIAHSQTRRTLPLQKF